jgi:tetratricopeptide (TPR) repeat protein
MLKETIVHDQDIKFVTQVSNLSLEQLANIMKNAQTLDELGQYEEAVSWYDLAIKNYPLDIVAWYNKGNVLDNIGKLKEAISCYDKVLEIIPNDISSMYNKAIVLSKIGKFEEATSLFEEIISIDPTHIGALTNRRVSLDKLGIHYGITLIKKKQML